MWKHADSHLKSVGLARWWLSANPPATWALIHQVNQVNSRNGCGHDDGPRNIDFGTGIIIVINFLLHPWEGAHLREWCRDFPAHQAPLPVALMSGFPLMLLASIPTGRPQKQSSVTSNFPIEKSSYDVASCQNSLTTCYTWQWRTSVKNAASLPSVDFTW